MYAIDVNLQQNGKMNGCNYDVRTETRLYDIPWLSANACARINATECNDQKHGCNYEQRTEIRPFDQALPACLQSTPRSPEG